MSKKIEKCTKKSINAELEQWDHIAKESDFIEVTEWANGEGFDVYLESFGTQRISLTWGSWKALKHLVKKLDNFINEQIN